MKYLVCEITEYNNPDFAAEDIADTLSDRDYDEYLDEKHGAIIICGDAYAASEILKGVSRDAYHTNMKAWKAEMTAMFNAQLKQLEPGESVMLGDRKIECVENGVGV